MVKPNPSIEPESADEVAKKQRPVDRQYENIPRKRRKQWKDGGNTRIAHDVRTTRRHPPAAPEVPLHVMLEMDADSESFVILRAGASERKWTEEGTPDDALHAFDLMRKKKQQRAQARRAKVRKYEAVVMAAKEKLEEIETEKAGSGVVPVEKMDIYDEDKLIAEGILDLEDWDDEELIRGYRRRRDGHFGRPPKFIPREVQQEAFRKLVHRGERKMRGAYVKAVEGLVDLAHNASSEKVRLDAQKELMSRVVGKVPDRTIITAEEPWVDILADSVIPISAQDPIEMQLDDDGVAHAEPIVVDLGEGGVPDASDAEATRRDVPPPPSPKSKTNTRKAPKRSDK